MKNKGFTLVEIIAVISIIGVLVVIATAGVSKYINSSRETTKNNTIKDVQDAAVSYALHNLFIQDSCSINSLNSDGSPRNLSATCKKTVKVSELISKGLLNDKSNILNRNTDVIIFKYKPSGTNTAEVRAYVPASVIK